MQTKNLNTVIKKLTKEERVFNIILFLIAVYMVFVSSYLSHNLNSESSLIIFESIIRNFGIFGSILLATSVLSLTRKELSQLLTTIQIIVTLILIITVPLSLWGILIIMRKKERLTKRSTE